MSYKANLPNCKIPKAIVKRTSNKGTHPLENQIIPKLGGPALHQTDT